MVNYPDEFLKRWYQEKAAWLNGFKKRDDVQIVIAGREKFNRVKSKAIMANCFVSDPKISGEVFEFKGKVYICEPMLEPMEFVEL